EGAKGSKPAGRGVRRDRDWLVSTSTRNIVQVWNVPLVALAGSDPDGIRVKTQLVPSRHRHPELIKLRVNRFIIAGDNSHTLKFPYFGVRARHRLLELSHLRLSLKSEHRERRALRRSVKHREFHRACVAPLVSGIITLNIPRRPFCVRRHCLV